MPKAPKWRCKALSRNVHRLTFDFTSRNQAAYVLLSSDRHWDNPHSDLELQRKHLDEAVERGAPIIDNGDLFCMMQGRADPRSSKSDCRPEHQAGDYFDAVINTGADFFEPYAHNLCLLGTGNHETGVLKRMEFSPTTRLAERLRAKTGATIFEAGYTSWIIVQVRRITSGSKRPSSSNIKIWRTHGHGTGGGFNQGSTNFAKIQQFIVDADLILHGHVHREYMMTSNRVRLSSKGTVYQDTQTFLQIPSYKDEYGDGYSGVKSANWAVERGMPPKPIGAMWLKVFFDRDRLTFAIERAQ